jgi:hypothetical protein
MENGHRSLFYYPFQQEEKRIASLHWRLKESNRMTVDEQNEITLVETPRRGVST